MTIFEAKGLFESRFAEHFYALSKISEDDANHVSLCPYKNEFLDYDKIAKKYHASWPSVDMIFFDEEKEYVVFVEYKNAKMDNKTKRGVKQKFLDSFALFYKILQVNNQQFWNLKTYLIFVTNKDKNPAQENNRKHLSSTDEFLDILEADIILYNLDIYKPWYFNEIKTPFCDEFALLMEQEFQIILEEDQ